MKKLHIFQMKALLMTYAAYILLMFTNLYCPNDPKQVHSCKILLPGDVIGRLRALHTERISQMCRERIPEVWQIYYGTGDNQ
jgi:hypothetical protein